MLGKLLANEEKFVLFQTDIIIKQITEIWENIATKRLILDYFKTNNYYTVILLRTLYCTKHRNYFHASLMMIEIFTKLPLVNKDKAIINKCLLLLSKQLLWHRKA